MNAIAVHSARFAWLAANLADTRARIGDLLGKLSGLGPSGALKPALFKKFLSLLGEVAAAKTAEIGLLNRIETIEQKHRFMRKRKMLKRAGPKSLPAYRMPANQNEAELRRKHRQWLLILLLWLIVLWNLIPRLQINQKKQGLTAN